MGLQNTKSCSIPFLGFKLLSIRRECERAWSALGTEDRMRKKERNTVRQAGGELQWVCLQIAEMPEFSDLFL